MTSLIVVQINSIYKALEIKEEQFNGAVNSALSRIIYQLEMEEAAPLVELANSISSRRNTGIFPSNQKSIPGAVNLLSSKFSFKSSGMGYSEELIIDYGT